MWIVRFTPLLSLLLLAGCAVGPDYKKPAIGTPEAYGEPGPWKVAAPKDALPKDNWWKSYGDPALDDLEARTGLDVDIHVDELEGLSHDEMARVMGGNLAEAMKVPFAA